MKASFLLLCCLATAHGKDQPAHIDLGKLHDPATTASVIQPLVIPNDKDWSLTGYLLFEAPQRDGNPPLMLVGGSRDYISSNKGSSDYPTEDETALFGKTKPAISSLLKPSLNRIEEHVLLVFDENGDEIRPFGGNNYISRGYIFDFDNDGILDRADSTKYGLKEAPKHSIEAFELLSVEPEPRSWLNVIFNWHPNAADDANDWFFECFDENSDNIPEIAFGPKDRNEEIRHEIVFRWDPEKKAYSAGDLPEKSHIHIMQEGETLKSIAAKGGLGYPLLKNGGETEAESETSSTPSRQENYFYQSLVDRPNNEITAFFKGNKRRSAFDGTEGSFPDTLPENFFAMPPKRAAMALAQTNRTPAHREKYRLALDDLDGASPPPSGWANYDWASSGCYSFSSELYAVHFGTPDSVLVTLAHDSIGVVGRNPYADQPANNARLIKLSEKEATFLAETTFWLDRIRSKRTAPSESSSAFGYSTADGHGSFSIYPEDAPPREIASETDFASDSTSGHWTGDYDRTIFINLTGLLFRKGIPEMLGNRWESSEIEGQSLMTPTEDRLADRVGDDARKKLAQDFSAILKINSTSPLPPQAISRLCSAAGDEALVSLLPDLEKLHASLPTHGAEDKEFAALEKRFARDHFGNSLEDKPDEHKKAYARLNELREKRKFDLAANVREPLESAIAKLRLATDSARLKQEIIDEGPLAQWALNLLRRTEPGTWAILVSADFSKAEIETKRTIFSTIAAGHPPAAAQLLDDLDAEEKQSLILEITKYHQQHAPQDFPTDIPALLTLADSKKNDLYRRGEAMDILSSADLTPAQLRDFTTLLLAEIRNPQKGSYGSGTLGFALQALAALPDSAQHLDFVRNLPNLSENAFSDGFEALDAMTTANPEREKILASFLRTQFTKSHGMMNDHFAKALIYDLRSLAPEIAEFASHSPEPEDGDGASYSGGNFKSPVGQRYHIAREITALWTENDPATLARMWIAFVAAHPAEFNPNRQTTAARKIAAKHISPLPTPQRQTTIEEILQETPIPDYYPDTQTWLSSLK